MSIKIRPHDPRRHSAGGSGSADPPMQWPISGQVYTTVDQTFVPVAVTNPTPIAVDDLPAYSRYGYSARTKGPGIPCAKRTDMAAGYTGAPMQ